MISLFLLSFVLGIIFGVLMVPFVARTTSRAATRKTRRAIMDMVTKKGEVEFIYPQDSALKEAFKKGKIKTIDDTLV